MKHLGMLRKVVSKWQGEQVLMGQPVTLTRTPSDIVRAAPRRGEHTEEILAEAGYGPEELGRMKAAGIY